MIVRLTSTWLPGRQAREDASPPTPAASNVEARCDDVPGFALASPEHDERYLMTVAESMLRAGYGHREIERALRRMSPNVSSDSGRLGVFRSLRGLLALPSSKLHAPGQGTSDGVHSRPESI